MIAGIILAAGLSRRMGRPKQLLDWGGIPLLRHVALQALASRLDLVLAVVGPDSPASAALADLPVALVGQPEPAAGLGRSLGCGVAALPAAASAALILLGDQPFITAPVIDRLLDAARQSDRTIIAPRFGGRRGNPVLFKAGWFGALAGLDGDQGAHSLLTANPGAILLAPIDAHAQGEVADADLDDQADYARLHRLAFGTDPGPEAPE